MRGREEKAVKMKQREMQLQAKEHQWLQKLEETMIDSPLEHRRVGGGEELNPADALISDF